MYVIEKNKNLKKKKKPEKLKVSLKTDADRWGSRAKNTGKMLVQKRKKKKKKKKKDKAEKSGSKPA